jgi:DNA primase
MRDGREARFLFLPDGEDPDTLIRKEGRERFEQRIIDSTPLSSFLFDKLESEVDMASLGGRARLAEQAKPLLGKLPSGLFREMMHQRLAQRVGLEPGQLGSPAAAESPRPRPPVRNRSGARQMLSPARRAITLLLLRPELARITDLPYEWRAFRAPGISLLGQLLEIAQNQPNLRTAQIIERWRDKPEYPHLEKIWSTATELPTPEDGMEMEFRGALQRLVEQQREQETTQLLERVSTGDASEQEKQRLGQLLSEKQKIADLHKRSD